MGWCETLEKAAAVKRLYAVLDKNQDGKINASEYRTFLTEALGGTATLEQAEKSMAYKDTDKDGTLSEEEVAASCKSIDAATINEWCKKLEGRPKAAVASPGWFSCCFTRTTSDDFVVAK